MLRIQWTELARADLRAIHAYIARDSAAYANRLIDRIIAAVGRLVGMPKLGGRVEQWDRPDIRELVVGHYRIIYRLRPDLIEVLTVLHGARLLPDAAPETPNGPTGAG